VLREEGEAEEEQVLRSLPARVTTSIYGGDHQCHGVPGHRQAEASEDGLRLLRVRRRGRVDAAGEQGGLLQDLVSSLSLTLHISFTRFAFLSSYSSAGVGAAVDEIRQLGQLVNHHQ
jgi:hypothetical protein